MTLADNHEWVTAIKAARASRPSALQVLHASDDAHGHLPKASVRQGEVHGVLANYGHFRITPHLAYTTPTCSASIVRTHRPTDGKRAGDAAKRSTRIGHNGSGPLEKDDCLA